MTGTIISDTWGGTTAGGWPGAMLRAGATVIATCFLVGPAGSTSATPNAGIRHSGNVQTNSGFILQERARKRTAAEGVSELRRVAGLTWEQLARLFQVSRRSVHFWASGQQMSAEHEERLHRLLACVLRIDRGHSDATRAALLDPASDGTLPFDLLVEGKWDEAVDLVGEGDARAPARVALKAEPPTEWRPEHMAGAVSDLAHESQVGAASTRGRARRERG